MDCVLNTITGGLNVVGKVLVKERRQRATWRIHETFDDFYHYVVFRNQRKELIP